MFWDVSDGVSPRARPGRGGHRDWVTGCSWGPRHAASCSNDGLVRLWDPESVECLREMKGHSSLTAICIVGEFVVSTTGSGVLHVWADSGASVTNIPAHACAINYLVACRGKRERAAGEEDGEITEHVSIDNRCRRRPFGPFEPAPPFIVIMADHPLSITRACLLPISLDSTSP
ncbi:telomerase protein component 1-like [Leucoraja erinacea]|uniref:telomerase protein component 1-like n=1 Tax=Leucoraja erinaceus TaxID=7782 RepID=UPI002456FB0C|nr:telomerase protein component 1-like [Leucoraja erinacea]